MRRLSEIFDFAVIFGLSLAGYYQQPMILIVVGIDALAAEPIARSYAKARARPDIDARHILRSITIDSGLYATAAAMAAYLIGRLVALWN